MTQSHTPTPWTVFTEETPDGENVYPVLMTADYSKRIIDNDIFDVDYKETYVSPKQTFINAAYIVKAVNFYAEIEKGIADRILTGPPTPLDQLWLKMECRLGSMKLIGNRDDLMLDATIFIREMALAKAGAE